MYIFSNKNKKILSYFCHVININSSHFQETNDDYFIAKEPESNNKPEFVDMNSQINSNISFQVRQDSFIIENETSNSESINLSLLDRVKNENQAYGHHSLSMPVNTQEVSHCIINNQPSIAENKSNEENNSSENGEIDVEEIGPNDGNIYSALVASYNESAPIEKRIFRDTTKSQKLIHGELSSPYLSGNSGAIDNNLKYISTQGYDYNTTRLHELPSSYKRCIINTTRVPITTIANFDRCKRLYPEPSHELDVSRKFLNESPKKKFKYILPVEKSHNGLVPSIPQSIKTTNHELMNTQNQSKSSQTCFQTHSEVENSRRLAITKTPQKMFNNIGLKTSHEQQTSSDNNFQYSMKNYEVLDNNKALLEQKWGCFYSLNFIIKNIFLSFTFNQRETLNIYLNISDAPIIRNRLDFAKDISHIPIKDFYYRSYVYYIPIFHMVDFVCTNNIGFLQILLNVCEYRIEQKLDIYVYMLRPAGEIKLRLKCPHISEFNQIIIKLLKTKFQIFSFYRPATCKNVRFHTKNFLGEVINGMTLNEYIEEVNKNPLDIDIHGIKEYKTRLKFNKDKIKCKVRNRIVWNSALQVAYDIFTTFDQNIKKIVEIINDVSITSDFKKGPINSLLEQIIKKLENRFDIEYLQQMCIDPQKEFMLMSFYIFSTNELKNLFEWWNKYIFVNEEVEYIETGILNRSEIDS